MKPKFNTSDPDIIGSFAALKRAARKARQLSIETGTPFIVVQNGKIVDLNAGLNRRAPKKSASKRTTFTGRRGGLRKKKP